MREPQEGDEVKGDDAPELSSRPLGEEEDSAANCTARRREMESERVERGGGGGGEKNAPKASLFPEEPTTTEGRGSGRGTQNTHDALNTF